MLEGFTAQATTPRPSSQSISGSQHLQVSWLRRTEYVTAKDGISRGQVLARCCGYIRPRIWLTTAIYREDEEDEEEIEVDISRDAQIQDVEATFPPSYRGIDPSTIKHPTKPNRKAVEVFDLLPDPETFATTSDIFRFPERPGERSLFQEDPRLDCALLRPVRLDDGENFIAYYLARDDEEAVELKRQRTLSLELNMLAADSKVGSFWFHGCRKTY